MKKILAIFLLIPFFGFGAIEPVIIRLDTGGSSYTVPANKVLVIEHARTAEGGDFLDGYIGIISGGTTNAPILMGQRTSTYFDAPIKIPASSILFNALGQVSPTSTNSLFLFCLLVDPSDLYASIDAQTDNIIATGGLFSFDVHTASARPSRISIQGSTNLAVWQPVDAIVAKKASNTYTVSVPTGSENYFVKYRVREKDS